MTDNYLGHEANRRENEASIAWEQGRLLRPRPKILASRIRGHVGLEDLTSQWYYCAELIGKSLFSISSKNGHSVIVPIYRAYK